jgi:hypothetical protein
VRRTIAITVAGTALALGACGGDGGGEKRVTLSVEKPKQGSTATDPVVLITGKVTPGAEVTVDEVFTADASNNEWSFQHDVERGDNVVHVTARKEGYRPAAVALRFRGKPFEVSTPGTGGFIETPQLKKGKKPKTGAAKWTGQNRENYEIAKFACGAFSRKKVARDLGITSTDPIDLAQKYSEGYRGPFRQAAFEGCLAGL